MIDRREEITRVLVLMGLADDWHVEHPADVRDVVIIQSKRGPRVSVPVSFPDVSDNPDYETKTNRIQTAIAKAIVLAHVIRRNKPRLSP